MAQEVYLKCYWFLCLQHLDLYFLVFQMIIVCWGHAIFGLSIVESIACENCAVLLVKSLSFCIFDPILLLSFD